MRSVGYRTENDNLMREDARPFNLFVLDPHQNACGKTQYTGAVLMDFLRVLIAIFIPPLGVFLQEGIGKHFWINIVLTLLGYIPGIVHAVWIIVRK